MSTNKVSAHQIKGNDYLVAENRRLKRDNGKITGELDLARLNNKSLRASVFPTERGIVRKKLKCSEMGTQTELGELIPRILWRSRCSLPLSLVGEDG